MVAEDDLVETAVKRREFLSALAERPHHRRELESELAVSKTTCHRVVRSFEREGLLRQTDRGYELSPLGRTVAERLEQFRQGVETASQVVPLVEAFESAPVEFDPGLFADATITRPTTDDPTSPVDRFLELFRGAETVRSLDCTSFAPPLYVERMVDLVLETGGSGVAVFPKSVVERRIAEYPALHRRVVREQASLEYRVNDEIPFGLTLFDGEHVALRAYDDETGTPLLFVDTADTEAVAWAETVFDHYYDRSTDPAEFDAIPDWVPSSDTDHSTDQSSANSS